MKILKAEVSDSAILTELVFRGKAFWGYDSLQMEKWRKDLTISEEYIEKNDTYKLIFEDKILGCYSFLKLEKHIIKLDFLFLVPEFIGKGFGKFLLLDCIERAKNNAIKTIVLDADPNAENFYKHSVFEVYNYVESSVKGRFLPQMKFDLKQ